MCSITGNSKGFFLLQRAAFSSLVFPLFREKKSNQSGSLEGRQMGDKKEQEEEEEDPDAIR